MSNKHKDSERQRFQKSFLRIKKKIFIRDNFECQNNTTQHFGKLTIDHIRKRSLGGKNEESNLITLCKGCHSGYEQISNYIKEQRLRRILATRYNYIYN